MCSTTQTTVTNRVGWQEAQTHRWFQSSCNEKQQTQTTKFCEERCDPSWLQWEIWIARRSLHVGSFMSSVQCCEVQLLTPCVAAPVAHSCTSLAAALRECKSLLLCSKGSFSDFSSSDKQMISPRSLSSAMRYTEKVATKHTVVVGGDFKLENHVNPNLQAGGDRVDGCGLSTHTGG